MADWLVESDTQALAKVAAEQASNILNKAIDEHGQAIWVLAGGTTPMKAYEVLATDYQERVDWSKVIVLIGDERCVSTDSPDSNWFQISHAFLDKVAIPEANKLRPQYELPAEQAADDYIEQLQKLPLTDLGVPRFDLVWIGMGEDGHTLSLFPKHPGLQNTELLVIPVHHSPKPPPDRITLTLRALQSTAYLRVLTAGAAKQPIILAIKDGNTGFPIQQAVQTVESHGGQATWLIDDAANSK